jgi:hypothetical protein
MDADYAREYWSLANVIVGFAIAQALSFVLTIGSGQGLLAQRVGEKSGVVVFAVAISTLFYSVLIFGCQYATLDLLNRQISVGLDFWFRTLNAARIVIVIAVNCACAWLALSLGDEYRSQKVLESRNLAMAASEL